MPRPLEQEQATFDAHRAELLGRAKGKYVLIKGSKILGDFTDIQEALKNGYERFGNQPFLVKLVAEVDAPLSFTSHQIHV